MTPEEKRDIAMDQVESRAEKENSWDRDQVADFVVAYLRKHGPTSSEDITDAAKIEGHIPHDDRAFGPIYSRLSRQKSITHVRPNNRRRKGHATHGGYVWDVA